MRITHWKWMLPAALVWWLMPAHAHAQNIGLGSIEYLRNTGPGYVTPEMQEPFSHRYGYQTAGGAAYIGWPAGKFDYLEYIDRVERAEKFGYRVPPPPCGWAPVWSWRQR